MDADIVVRCGHLYPRILPESSSMISEDFRNMTPALNADRETTRLPGFPLDLLGC